MGSDTRYRIVDAAARLFREQGVTGTGVLAVLAAAQAPRGSLYHHFPGGKDQLVVEALQHESDRVTEHIAALLLAVPDEAAGLVVFAEALAVSLERSDFRMGCPVTTAVLELSHISPGVRAVCALTYGRWQELLVQHLMAAGREAAEAGGLAELVLSALEGALLLARADHDAQVVRRVAAQLSRTLERRLEA